MGPWISKTRAAPANTPAEQKSLLRSEEPNNVVIDMSSSPIDNDPGTLRRRRHSEPAWPASLGAHKDNLFVPKNIVKPAGEQAATAKKQRK
jgi:hypothetical protein